MMKYMPGKVGSLDELALMGSVLISVILIGTFSTNVRADEPQATGKYLKILFLGNSITLHGPAPKIGWKGNWGMAASAPEKDFVHIVTGALAKSSGATPKTLVRNIAAFERQYATYDLKQNLKEAFAFQPDLVVLAIGENVPKLETEEAKAQFKASVDQLLKELQTDNQPTIIVRSCFWPNPAKDAALRQACQQAGGMFVDISSLGKEESNYARSERDFQHAGVAAHPGDKGMQAIADAILKVVQP
ncbi:SGNH/GDSL hydrolase family protein [Gimesia fumaroli]|nr:SGNH/GDSL hydrolase family protein [Gimesia fumaroli]